MSNVNDVSAGSSPAQTNTSSTSESSASKVDSLVGTDMKAAFSEFSAQREAERNQSDQEDHDGSGENHDMEASDPTSSEEDHSDNSSDPQSGPQKQKQELSPGVKKRIDTLTARLRSEEKEHKATALENARLKEAVRLYQEEVERIQKFAKLDPSQERIRQLELEREIEKIERDIPTSIDQRFSQREQEAQVQERVAEIISEIKSVAAEWDGVFTSHELAMYMKQTGVRNPAQAAKSLGESRLQAAQKKMKSPAHPSTSGTSGNTNREPASAWKYKGSSSVLEFLEKRDNQRSGR